MKQRSLEQIEAQMAKLREKKDALHAERQALAAERRQLILADQTKSNGGVVLQPEPAKSAVKGK